MYIDSGLLVRALAAGSSFVSTLGPQHSFQPAGPGDVRSPCPALNSLANHGLLPRNGKNITADQYYDAITTYYNIAPDLATTLISTAIAYLGDLTTETLSLNILARHNVLEHDASLAHADAVPGASYASTVPDLGLLKSVSLQYPHGVGIQELAKIRNDRESKLTTPLDSMHETLALGESALASLVVGVGDKIPIKTWLQWFGQETFPDTYVVPKTAITIDIERARAGQIAAAQAALRGTSV